MDKPSISHDREITLLTNVTQVHTTPTTVKTIADRLKETRKSLGISQPELARRAGVSPGTIGNIESGVRKNPRELLEIASALGVSAEWLKSGKVKPAGEPGPEDFTEGFGLVPLISSALAGSRNDAHEGVKSSDAELWLPCPVCHGARTFAIRVEGDSMDGPGGYREGEIAFVDPDVAVKPGRDVAVQIAEGRVTLRRLKEDAEGLYFIALNPAWPERIARAPNGALIRGVVIGSFIHR